ncbi:LysR family transcriptional regulator [Methylobacterium aquaticum]|jgi:DNA-binding transcriptional LysR family regulator|uniref:LysR family transcriptional regulator n=1 Tax=Methylobacterium aquaticum TaxID=270351 RepID=A0A0J6S9T8_9HYPH|nr:LysR family transcriptional regulator [Methylobacterium aquaticum]KMO30464.1 LysR family transcriptional regulator [Methylobacterium aquaticum]
MSISLKQIRYFIAAAESGRISQAAVELNVSQSAVTAAVQQLEALLGVRLFERHAAGVALTREGNRFLLHGRNIMAAVAEAVREPRAAGAAVTGTVRVGVTYTVAGYFLPRHHARFASSFPGVTLTLFEAPRDVIEQALLDGALDIAVMLVSNLQARDALAAETLIRSRRRLWLPAEHPLLRQGRVGLSDVARHPYIMLTVDEAGHTAGRYWALTPFRPEVIFRTSSVESVRSMVAAGMGVTILSDLVYRPWSLEGQRLERRQIEDEIPTMDVGLAWRADTALTPAARTFREFVNLACAGQG